MFFVFSEIHQAAKETVALAEARFFSKQHEWQFDTAWQEMLNHATCKVVEAEVQRATASRHHQTTTAKFHQAEAKVRDFHYAFIFSASLIEAFYH